MNLIVSATTARTATSAPASASRRRRGGARDAAGSSVKLEKIRQAQRALIKVEHYVAQGDLVLALEYAYRASIRLAGARIADSPVAQRVRKPKGVWDQLEMVDICAARWANAFRQYSTIRSRAMGGLRQDVTITMVMVLVDLNRRYMELLMVGDYLTGPEGGALSVENQAA